MRTSSFSFTLLACVVLLAACSAPRETRRDGATPPRTETPAEPSRPVAHTVQGFRIQVLTTPEKAAADQVAEQARAWWQSLPASQRPSAMADGTVVDVKWKQPSYRVHIGAFASLEEAEKSLQLAARTFPEVFIVP